MIAGNVVRPPNLVPTRVAATVCQPGPYDGLETCFSDDGASIDIRADDDSYVTFHSWSEGGSNGLSARR